MVYIVNKNGVSFMPTKRRGKVRRMLKSRWVKAGDKHIAKPLGYSRRHNR